MRITKVGTTHKGYEGLWKCRKCGSEFIMDGSDPEPEFVPEYPRDGGNYYKTPCPVCKEEVLKYR